MAYWQWHCGSGSSSSEPVIALAVVEATLSGWKSHKTGRCVATSNVATTPPE
jgi:hypothetical protein